MNYHGAVLTRWELYYRPTVVLAPSTAPYYRRVQWDCDSRYGTRSGTTALGAVLPAWQSQGANATMSSTSEDAREICGCRVVCMCVDSIDNITANPLLIVRLFL